MPYLLGIVLSLGVALFARSVGFDRDRAFYPTVLMVVASYHVLVAVMSGSVHTMLLGIAVGTHRRAAACAGRRAA